MSSVRIELEKRKLENRIRQREQGVFNGASSWVRAMLAGESPTNSLTTTISEELKRSADQFLEGPDKIDKIIDAASLLKGSKSSMGTVILGSIIGGIIASRFYLKKGNASDKITAENKSEGISD